MKKLLILFTLLILICGCSSNSRKKEINTIIEEEKNILIAINYPITNYKKLDTIVKKDVEDIYNQFKEEYENFESLKEQSELNIDYTFDIVNQRFINITLHIFINSSTLTHPNYFIKTYVYDQKQNQLITIKDLIEEDSFEKLSSLVKMEIFHKYKECSLTDEISKIITPTYYYPLFTFDAEQLHIYFNPNNVTASYCSVIDLDIHLSELHIKIDLMKETLKETTPTITKPIKIIDPSQKVVALTFDDGPSKYTDEIINILKENDAYATFFVIGNKVEIYKETLQKMIKNGNEIGNHSYNHKWLTKLTEEDLQEQIMQTQDIIKKETGFTPTLIRPTYGSINEHLREVLPLKVVMWTVDTRDWKYKSVDTIVKKGTKVKDLDIILMHDTHKRTLEALKKIIPELKKQGYELVTVSELEEIKLLRNNKVS